jgi:DNA-binding transcriptional MocR family regulator
MKSSGYQQIARTIRDRITSGQYTPGEKIPSIRQFADDFQCNKLTVHRAFDTLKQEGLIENRVGSGSYVRYPEKVAAPHTIFDFHTDYLDESLFPYQQLQNIFNQLFKHEKAHALAPTPAQGDGGLIGVLSQFYHVPSRKMVIISGAQQGLDLVAKVFAANISESMLFEDPTYPGAISLFKARHFVALDVDGPDLARLKRMLAQAPIRLFYTMPAVHNPTGLAYSRKKKEAVSQLARRHKFYIVEDNFLSEFGSQDGYRFVDICPERTIHIKSLSQSTVAGIRLGFMVIPENLYDKFLYAKFSSDIASFGLLQRGMREFFKLGHYEKHLDQVRRIIGYRKKKLISLIDTLDQFSISKHQAGYSLWVKSERPVTQSPVPWSGGVDFSFRPEARFFFRLSFMHMDEKTFENAVSYLKKLWQAG